MTRSRAGDRPAFGVLVERHRALLQGLVTRLVRDPGLVDDVVQDAIVTALTELHRLREPGSFGPWLAGIGLNTGRRLLRGRGRECSLDELLGGRSAGPVPADPTPSPELLAESAELAARVAAAVAALPPGQAAAVGVFYLAGLSYAETAEHLGVPVGAVRTRLHKARTTLRTTLADLRPEEPMSAPTDRVRMTVSDVRRIPDPDGDAARHVVLLAEEGGEARLQMWIGPHEATALALALSGADLPRPSSYRMVASLLATTAVQVVDVTITDLVDGVFLARLATSAGHSVDARPSDAVNLAMELGVPVYASRAVLDDGARAVAEVGGDGYQALVESAMAQFAASRGSKAQSPPGA